MSGEARGPPSASRGHSPKSTTGWTSVSGQDVAARWITAPATPREGSLARDSPGGEPTGSNSAAGEPPTGDPPGRNPPGKDPPADPESVARTICLRLLAGAPKTRAQLADALHRNGVPGDVAERVLDRLGDVGLVDDAAFAEAWVQSRHAGRGLARRALRSELRRRGIDDETVGEALDGLDNDDEVATARRLVDRKLPSTRRLEPATRSRRLVGMLARKGYPYGVTVRVVREALEAEGVWEADLADVAEPEPEPEPHEVDDD